MMAADSLSVHRPIFKEPEEVGRILRQDVLFRANAPANGR